MYKWSFLWITDLHFALPDANYLDDAKELTELEAPFRDDIFQDVYGVLRDGFGDSKFDFIAVGGDITSHGKASGFSRFQEEMIPLLERLVDDRKAICVVPGNHDVTWALDSTKQRYFDRKFQDFRNMVETAEITSCLFPAGNLKKTGKVEKLAFNHPLSGGPLYLNKDKRILILNLNSAIRCGELDKRMYDDIKRWSNATSLRSTSTVPTPAGADDIPAEDQAIRRHLIRDVAHVTQSQIILLTTELQKHRADIGDDWFTYLKVAIVHHHLVHYPDQQPEHKGYEFMVDSSQVLQLLSRFDFDIALTGHKHFPYEMKYPFREKEIFIVGGPTVGGFSADASYRGFRLISFEADQFRRKLSIKDLEHGFGRRDVVDVINKCVTKELSIKTSEKEIVARGISQKGYGYREIASITRISSDGDAYRSVECEHLIVRHECSRMSGHEIELPSTSGYLDQFQTGSDTSGVDVQLDPDRALPKRLQCGNIVLKFRPDLEIDQPLSYHYQWNAVNSFALDKRQFLRKYGDDRKRLPDTEFTHYHPRDPMERLTVIVQFPRGFVPSGEPTLRIARVDTGDPRLWELDKKAKKALEDLRVLRHFKSLNIVALRVKAPSTTLSYGIEWKLPDAPIRPGAEQVLRILRHFERRSTPSAILDQILIASRETMLPTWRGVMDANLMIFGLAAAPLTLSTVAAVRSLPTPDVTDRITVAPTEVAPMEKIRTDIPPLPYGLGIAGRAFKANRIRIYVAPDSRAPETGFRSEPDFYIPLENSPVHKRLISFPLHPPVSDTDFKRNANVYLGREPYRVLTIGSESDECPISKSLPATKDDDFKAFQHRINSMVAAQTFGMGLG